MKKAKKKVLHENSFTLEKQKESAGTGEYPQWRGRGKTRGRLVGGEGEIRRPSCQ
ncbi:MAG: hypothetical protein J7L47_03615 [Candidatus Odinarchaeota archaeon]|nr:hypothetical protein [Candidatus Odinarchaeota archaeon]